MSKRGDGINVDPRTGLYGFCVTVSPPGVRPRKQARRRGFATVKAAKAARAELLNEVSTQTFVPPQKVTLADFLEQTWLPAVESTLRRSTFESYARNIRLHVRSHEIGSVRLQALTEPMLNAWYSDLLAGRGGRRALSARTVSYLAVIVHRGLREAVAWRLLMRNPSDGSTPPVVRVHDRRQIKVWSAAQLRSFLEATSDDRNGALWRLLATTGCRRGEALGLRWADVDIDAGRLSFAQTLIEVEGAPGFVFGTPKTAAGQRTVSIDALTVAALRSQRARQSQERLLVGAGWRDHDLVFCRPDGSPLQPKVISNIFGRAAKRHGLPHLSVHGLRHTWATLALQSKVSPRVVQQRLGHSNVAVTLSVYSHVTPDLDVAAAEEVAARIAAGK